MSRAIRGHEAAQMAASDPVVWSLLALLAAIALSWGGGPSARQPAFKFEAYGHLSDRDAASEVDAHLNRLFRAGSRLQHVRAYVEVSGARCWEPRNTPDFVYCTYRHAAPELASSYLTMEWKLWLWYDGVRERFTCAEVRRDSFAF